MDHADERATDERATDERATESRGADVLPFPSLGLHAAELGEPPPRLRTVIGDVLRAERHDQGRTLADVASAASVSLPYLSEVERGAKEVSSDLLAAICGALELDLADVLQRSAHRVRTGRSSASQVRALAA